MCPRYGFTWEMGYLVKRPRGGVTGPNGVVGAGVTGRMKIGRSGCVPVRGPVSLPEEGGVRKKSVYAGVRRLVEWMSGARIDWIRSWLMNASRPFSLATMTNSTGHVARERSNVAPSDCSCAGTKRM